MDLKFSILHSCLLGIKLLFCFFLSVTGNESTNEPLCFFVFLFREVEDFTEKVKKYEEAVS